MQAIVQIKDKELKVKEFNGARVVTLKDIDEVHQRPENTAKRNFAKNKKHFVQGEDYFVRNSYEAKNELGITAPSGLNLITESGYLMLVKSFTDDLAREVQRMLVNNYFRKPEPKQPDFTEVFGPIDTKQIAKAVHTMSLENELAKMKSLYKEYENFKTTERMARTSLASLKTRIDNLDFDLRKAR